MRILHVLPEMSLGCGVSASVFSASEAMVSRGHKVWVISGSVDSYYLNKLQMIGVCISYAPLLQYKKSLFSYLKAVAIIYRFILKQKINLLHSHHRWNCLIGSLSAKLAGIISITSDHNVLWGQRLLSFKADGIITDSIYNREHLKKYFHILDDRIRIVAPLINKSRYDRLVSGKQKENHSNEFNKYREDGVCLIGQVARLSEEKGQKFLLEVIKELIQQNVRVRFLFLGDGVLKADLEKQALDSGISEFVSFLGKREDIIDFLTSLDIYIVSSYKEGFCLAAYEAIIAGLPVVATAVGGLPEQIKNGETGFLVERGDKDDFKEKLITLITNIEKRKQMGQLGKQHILERYSYEGVSEQLENAYKYFLSRVLNRGNE